jgi:hypothetical protein
MPETSKTRRSSELPQLCALLSRHLKALVKRNLGFSCVTRRGGQQRLGPQAMQLGFDPSLSRVSEDFLRLG